MSELNVYELLKIMPHRYPFMLLDRVLECNPGESIVAIKNVTMNEPFFQGHFPEKPVMPGVMISEAMAQATGVLTHKTLGGFSDEDSIFLLVGFDKLRYKRQVIPGDTLTIKAAILRRMRNIWRFDVRAYVGDELACSAESMGAMTKVQL